jgi:hypothetical protein
MLNRVEGKITLHDKGGGMGLRAFTRNRYSKVFNPMGFAQFFTISKFCAEVSPFWGFRSERTRTSAQLKNGVKFSNLSGRVFQKSNKKI